MNVILIIILLLIGTKCKTQVFENIFGEVYVCERSEEDGITYVKDYIKADYTFMSGFGMGTSLSECQSIIISFRRINKNLTTGPGFVFEGNKYSGINIGVGTILDFIKFDNSILSIRLGYQFEDSSNDFRYLDDIGIQANYKIKNYNSLFYGTLEYRHNFSNLIDVGLIYSIKSGAEKFIANIQESDKSLFRVNFNQWNWFERTRNNISLFVRLSIN